jgi:hypothetical protein
MEEAYRARGDVLATRNLSVSDAHAYARRLSIPSMTGDQDNEKDMTQSVETV